MKKRVIAALVAAAVAVTAGACAISGCGGTIEADSITGYFYTSYDVEGYGTAWRFFHFYEDAGYGQFVYIGAQTGSSGTTAAVAKYEVAEKDYEYKVWNSRTDVSQEVDGANYIYNYDDSNCIKGTAKYTVTLSDVEDGSVLGTMGWDGSYVYTGESVDFVPAGGVTDMKVLRYAYDADGTEASMTTAYNNEAGCAVLTFYDSDDPDNYFVQLNQNGSYVDGFATSGVRGDFTYAGGVFTLGNGATVTPSADGKSATYANGTTSLTLVSTKPEVSQAKEAWVTMTGTMYNTMASADATATLTLYTDYTCDLEVSIYGNSSVIDTGTFTTGSYGTPDSITLSAGGTLTVSLSTSGLSVTVPAYSSSGLESGTLTGSTPTSALPEKSEETKTVLITLTGSIDSTMSGVGAATVSLILYKDDDKTCEVIAESYGTTSTIDSGTYTMGTNTPDKITLTTGGELTVTTDYSTMSLTVTLPGYSSYYLAGGTLTASLSQS